ncbi:MAG: hypothetical protein CBB97_06540 [Candidatus Endolissoclinum sp. TMED37]|nr:MAG: hypothetical protein CBB97_06540 [Candidatus Endolissoclinum sp. TMED37]|tara:strand:+ start:395 stop:1147 length:753 start_codon:yes stop_codon:yes gene_type:complete
MKNFIKKIFNFFGFEIHKKKILKLSFDEIYKKFFTDNIIIFDVGANKGQSIDRFKTKFPQSIIHAFEPIEKEFNTITEKFAKDNTIIINNIAIGEEKSEKNLNLSIRTGVSSFNKFNLEHEWIKTRSKEYNTSVENFLNGKQLTKIETLDNYCKKNDIKSIDILKIDTQGYEDKILEGSMELLKNNNIKAIELEIIFDDTYDKYLTFSDIEKYLLPNFRFVGIKNYNNNLFEGINFFAEILYLNKKILKN